MKWRCTTLNKKIALTACFLAFTISITIAWATYPIWSNIVTITPRTYSLTLNADSTNPAVNTTLRFSGQLLLGTTAIPSATITLWESTNQVDWSEVAQNTTNIDGLYVIYYNITSTETVYYRARYDTP